ncbi:Zn-dependent hydrolase, partial [Micromonospora globispora]
MDAPVDQAVERALGRRLWRTAGLAGLAGLAWAGRDVPAQLG